MDSTPPRSGAALKTEVVVIGAGQAGLSAAYGLRKRGLAPHRGFVVLDRSPAPGGAWQFRWPSLTLSTVNRVHDLPGMPFSEAVDTTDAEVRASVAVPRYFAAYEKAFDLPVHRPVTATVVCDRGDRLRVETDRIDVSARGIINATGTWETPYVPEYPGAERFRGRQLHTRTTAPPTSSRAARGGGGRRHLGDPAAGRGLARHDHHVGDAQAARVPHRPLRRGGRPRRRGDGGGPGAPRPPARVRRLRHGPPATPAVEAMRERGVLNRLPMFSEITEEGVRWPDGTELRADVILWCTGFRSSLDHLAPLMLREEGGGITMTGRLATQVARDSRVHLVGYGPSASTIGANRAGRVAADELMAFLGLG
jgi:cation diffusion facilitator CzcD-associated flavoprotein CzcO